MQEEEFEQCVRLADLVIQALEAGTGKHEWDVLDELFATFGLDWNKINASVHARTRDRVKVLRRIAAKELVGATASIEELINAVMRCGGRFVSMVDGIYLRLSQHSATTSGSSETFHLRRAVVDETLLTINPAFLEKIRHLVDEIQRVPLGKVDFKSLGRFTCWDVSGFYGCWPLNDSYERKQLLTEVLNLRWLGPLIEQRLAEDRSWEVACTLWHRAQVAAESLVASSERIVRSHAAHLDAVAHLDSEQAAVEVFGCAAKEPYTSQLRDEIKEYRLSRSLWITVFPGFVDGVEENSALGLDADLNTVNRPGDGHRGSGVSDLAGFVAFWRLGLWADRERQTKEEQLFENRYYVEELLDQIISACDEASSWLDSAVLDITHMVDEKVQREAFEEFLSLPLWNRRDLLYEVWLLCATLDACEEAGWSVQLLCLTEEDRVWILSTNPTEEPVAVLEKAELYLDVWREPRRRTAQGELTPDLTVSTPRPYVRDLLVVEAKDRIKLASGVQESGRTGAQHSEFSSVNAGTNTAVGVARKYALGLGPQVTWLCNHCNFRQVNQIEENHGDAWTQIYVADEFRPGQIPEHFALTVARALRPQTEVSGEDLSAQPAQNGFILVLDMTGSMHEAHEQVFAALAGYRKTEHLTHRALLYSDHGSGEPYLIRDVGPEEDIESLVNKVRLQPVGHGGDTEEALEDAMHWCRVIAEDLGRQRIMVVTDAPPHLTADCPEGINFSAEVRQLLGLGCEILVVSNWMERPGLGDQAKNPWGEFLGDTGFKLAPLNSLLIGNET
ncbi:hypothetical protein GT020_11870 [Glutamicibacter soli]|uniref:VWA domain-containing protein n=1 Tax=Glutamicibacter soli TaxID=453836 RepID=A0A6L9G824_9MICC|nr:VWA domain-containing protein [Glutamicibacter soli]NAZ16755.1 hypothetical protein [Glutamicibacter soli]